MAVGSCGLLKPSFTLRQDANRNILLITIDTLRADALGAYGGRATTPNLDRLAAHGARFDFAHSHAVVTLVSHASILTGRYPYEHGIRDNTGYRLSPRQPTAATLLKSRGFATGAFIGGYPLDHQFGLNVGFDVYDDRFTSASGPEANDRERPADAVVKSALGWIGQRQSKWFAWVHLYDPHAPYQPPAEWAAKFPSDPYLGEVSWTDAALAPLLDTLPGQGRPTLIVVTGDHGESLGEHGELTHSLFAYEATIHVPLIVAIEKDTKEAKDTKDTKGIVVDTAVRHVDLLPTLLDSAGIQPDAGLPGVSLRDAIANGRTQERPSYFEAMSATVTRGWAPLRGVLLDREKYIDLPIPELYDLKADPKEASNVVNQRMDRARVLYETLKLFNVAPPARAQQESADTLERLRSLGYIGGGTATVKEKYTDADDPKRLIELEAMLTRAGDASRAGRADEAIGLYKTVIAKRPDTEDAYRKLALIYWRAGSSRDAIATLESALRAGVTQSEVRIKLAQYLTESGDPVKAIALLEPQASAGGKARKAAASAQRGGVGAPPSDVIKDAGDDPDALIALGNAYTAANRNADAIRTFERLLQLDSKNALAYQDLGTAQLRSASAKASADKAKDLKSAEVSLRRAIDLDSTLSGAYTALGVVLASTGRTPEAIDAWKKALALDPNDANARDNLRAVGGR